MNSRIKALRARRQQEKTRGRANAAPVRGKIYLRLRFPASQPIANPTSRPTARVDPTAVNGLRLIWRRLSSIASSATSRARFMLRETSSYAESTVRRTSSATFAGNSANSLTLMGACLVPKPFMNPTSEIASPIKDTEVVSTALRELRAAERLAGYQSTKRLCLGLRRFEAEGLRRKDRKENPQYGCGSTFHF